MANKPVLKLIGEMRWGEADWPLPDYVSLFNRLGNLPEKAGTVSRYMRFSGEAGGVTLARFFGIEMESIRDIPKGMIALEMGNDTITTYARADTGKLNTHRGSLTWTWLDRPAAGFPVGEFKTRLPTPRSSQLPLEFLLTGNAYFEKGKAADDDVRLVEYDPLWPAQFDEMAAWLRKTIPPEILLRVEHFGSTAIPGMPAKPVIDILIEIPSLPLAGRTLIPIFNQPECEYWGYSDHLLFIVRQEFMGTRTHHIHAAPAGQFRERIAFRDYLRTHPEDAGRYAALKHELARRHTADRETYTDAKGNLVQEITEKALKSGFKG